MTQTECIVLTEHNDWEGETWNFYVPMEGNETALGILVDKIGNDDEAFRVGVQTLDLETVLKLRSRMGYMNEHNVLQGILDIQKLESADWDDSPLYKGGIKGFLKP